MGPGPLPVQIPQVPQIPQPLAQVPQVPQQLRTGYAEISAKNVAANSTNTNLPIRPDPSNKGEVPIFVEKPAKFMGPDHEKRTEITYHKKKLIMRIKMEDFLPHIKGYTEAMSEDYVLKNPVTYSNRVTAIKFKIYNATGIPPHQLDILNLSISTKRVT